MNMTQKHRGRVNSFVPQSFLFYFWHMFYHSCQGRKHINLVLIAAHLNIFTGRENCSVLLDFFAVHRLDDTVRLP